MPKDSRELTSMRVSDGVNEIEIQTLENREIAFLIAKFLRERGVTQIFALCGGHILPIWDYAAALGIQIVDVRDERAAVHMAHAHAELTHSVGVAMVTAGPGMTNAVTGMANAYVSRVPVVVISGVPPRPQQYRGALQELPQAEIARPITRYARTVTYAAHVLRELDEAFACAAGQGNEPGPAFIEFPTDLLREELPPQLVEHERFAVREGFSSLPAQEIIQKAVDILWSSRRPVIISGRGARGAGEELARLLDAVGCVYLDTAESRGVISDDHPANCPAARGLAMTETELVLTIGRSLDFQLGYGSPAVFPNAAFMRIGEVPSELRGNRRGDLEICGAVPLVLDAMLQASSNRPPATDTAWVERIRNYDMERRERLQGELKDAKSGADGAMHPYRLLGERWPIRKNRWSLLRGTGPSG